MYMGELSSGFEKNFFAYVKYSYCFYLQTVALHSPNSFLPIAWQCCKLMAVIFMKTLSKRLLFFTFLSLMALISCEDYLPDNGGTDPGGTNPGGTNPGVNNPAELDAISGLANKLA